MHTIHIRFKQDQPCRHIRLELDEMRHNLWWNRISVGQRHRPILYRSVSQNERFHRSRFVQVEQIPSRCDGNLSLINEGRLMRGNVDGHTDIVAFKLDS